MDWFECVTDSELRREVGELRTERTRLTCVHCVLCRLGCYVEYKTLCDVLSVKFTVCR